MSIQGFPGCLRDNHTLNKIILVSLKGVRISRACSDDNNVWFLGKDYPEELNKIK